MREVASTFNTLAKVPAGCFVCIPSEGCAADSALGCEYKGVYLGSITKVELQEKIYQVTRSGRPFLVHKAYLRWEPAL